MHSYFERYTGFAAVFIVFALVGCGGTGDRAAGYLAKAQDLFDQQEYAKARLEIRNALQMKDNLVEGWLLRAKIQERLGDWRGAFTSYNKVISLDQGNLEGLTSRAHFYLLARKLDAAKKDYKSAVLVADSHPDVLFLDAAVAVAEGDRYRAQSQAELVLSVAPDHERARLMLAQLYDEQGSTDKAMALLREGRVIFPDSARIVQALARIYRRSGDQEAELGVLRQQAEQKSEQMGFVFAYAGALVHYGRVAAAEQLLRDMLDRAVGDDKQETALILSSLIENEKLPEMAETEVKALVEYMNNDPELLLRLAGFQLQQNKVSEPKAIYEGLVARFGTEGYGIKARQRLAQVLLAEGDKARASEHLETVLQASPRDGDALTMRASIAMQEQRVDDAISDLRVVVKDEPDEVLASDLLVKALLAQGNVELAAEQLEQRIKAAPRVEGGYLKLSELYTRLGRVDEARSVLRRLVKAIPPGSVEALSRSAVLEMRADRPDKALVHAHKLQKHAPDRAEGHYLEGLIHQHQGNHRKAISALQQALSKAELAHDPAVALVRSRIALNEPQLAEQELGAILQQNPRNFFVHNLLGELQARGGNTDSAIQSFNAAKATDPKYAQPYLNLASLHVRQGEIERALQELRLGMKAAENNSKLGLEIAKIYEYTQEFEKAIDEYKKVLAAAPDTHAAANNLAMLLVSHRPQGEGWRQALTLASRFEKSKNPVFRDTLGWISFKNGDIERALSHLEFATNSTSPDSEALYHLGLVYKAIGRLTDAKTQLGNALASTGDFVGKDHAREVLRELSQ